MSTETTRALASAMLPLVREQAMQSHAEVSAAVSSALTPRMRELLAAAAEWLDDNRNPFDHAFLVEHKVALDECLALSAMTGLAIQQLLDAGKYRS